LASDSTEKFSVKTPLDGDAFFTSAMTRTFLAPCRAPANDGTGRCGNSHPLYDGVGHAQFCLVKAQAAGIDNLRRMWEESSSLIWNTPGDPAISSSPRRCRWNVPPGGFLPSTNPPRPGNNGRSGIEHDNIAAGAALTLANLLDNDGIGRSIAP
jgi:hypothetical protein